MGSLGATACLDMRAAFAEVGITLGVEGDAWKAVRWRQNEAWPPMDSEKDQARRQAIARFRFEVTALLVVRPLAPGEKTHLLRDLSTRVWNTPDGLTSASTNAPSCAGSHGIESAATLACSRTLVFSPCIFLHSRIEYRFSDIVLGIVRCSDVVSHFSHVAAVRTGHLQ